MLAAIDAIDWSRIPVAATPSQVPGMPAPISPHGQLDLYEPDRVAVGLRALATATGLVRAADAGSLLAGGGLLHDHSGTVFPAAVTAAPFLLAIVRDGHPHAAATALGLLHDALAFSVSDGGRTRVATPYADAVPICCALADHLRGEAGPLAASGAEGRWLLADAAHHWRFDVREIAADGNGALALGVFAGRFPGGTRPAEAYRVGRAAPLLVQVAPPYPLGEDGTDACLWIDGVWPDELAPPTVLFPARGSHPADADAAS
ncbi:hypothetical protein [Streptomyces californicus]|uniref:hypothetical protein n=1 Tax=Streptomyces californicus TaxID=67351 RepID=UPI0037AC2FA6